MKEVDYAAQAIEQLACGRMIVLHDALETGGEGDILIAAEFATPEVINFMTKAARGPIFLVLTRQRCEELGLRPIGRRGNSRLAGASMVSIEAREGVTTGVSAADRARTIQVAVDPGSGPEDLHQPGHVLPLRACAGGVLERPARVEAAIDLTLGAGLRPAAVLCQVMREDGRTARVAELERFGAAHSLATVSVSAVLSHRLAAGSVPDPVGYRRSELREVMGHFATGVSVVTTRRPDGLPVGTTANAISSVSLRPPLILACLDRESETLASLRGSGRFAVNILGSQQRAHSERFAGKGAAACAHEVEFVDHELDVPVIPEALATIACEVDMIHPAGDHEIVVGAVRSLAHREVGGEPLLFYRGAYSRILLERDELAA